MSVRPISLLFFTNTYERGGAEEHMLTLLRGLDRTRFKCHLVCPLELANVLRADLPADVELLPLCLRNPRQLQTAYRLSRILRERRVDILHSHQFYSSLFASPIGWLCRVPIVVETPHGSERWRQGWFKSRFVVDRFIGRFVDHYIAVSEANARYLAEDKGLPRRKIVVIKNGCDVERFDPAYKPPAGLKASLGISQTDPVLVVAARLEPQKGHSVLLRALRTVRREFPQVRVICLGEGCLRGELESQVRNLNLGSSVHFLGHQSNIRDWLSLADFSVLPSLWEGLPLAVIESLAAGRAVVATAVDGTPEVVIDGKTGCTVPPEDPERLAEAICLLLREPGLAKRMGEAGRSWVTEHFTQERQIRETQDLYLRAWVKRRRAAKTATQTVETQNQHRITPQANERNL
jgi:glycosyltransferase involved in cell wall biosynthesis